MRQNEQCLQVHTFIYLILLHNCILEHKNQGAMHGVNLYFHISLLEGISESEWLTYWDLSRGGLMGVHVGSLASYLTLNKLLNPTSLNSPEDYMRKWIVIAWQNDLHVEALNMFFSCYHYNCSNYYTV